MLERLAGRHDVVALLTRPDAPRGRGRKVAAPPAKEVALRHGIPVLQPERLGPELVLDGDAVVVAAYGLLIPESLFERGLWLNVHPSLLPRWRGAAPVERAIMAGDDETGVTIHETVEALDAGPIAAQEAFPIGPDDDTGDVYGRATEVAVRLLDDVLPEPTLRPPAGAEARPAGAGGASHRRLPARGAAVCAAARDRRRVGRARPRRGSRAGRRVHERRPAPPHGRAARADRVVAGRNRGRGGAPAFLSGLGGRALVPRARARRRARTDATAERAGGDRRAPRARRDRRRVAGCSRRG